MIASPVTATPSLVRAWMIWGVAALFAFYQYMLQTSTGVLVGAMSEDFRMTSLGASLIASAYFYCYIILQVPAGLLLDKYGAKRLLRISIPLTALGCLLFGLAPNQECAFLARLFTGFASAPGFVGAIYLGATWLPVRLFALVAGLTEMLCMLGAAFGQKLLSALVNYSGWRFSMWMCALLGVLLAMLAWWLLEDAPVDSKKEELNQQKASVQEKISPYRAVLSSPLFWALGVFDGLCGATIPAFASMWGIEYLQAAKQLSLSTAAYGTGLIFVGCAISSTFVGMASDKIGRRKPIMYAGAVMALLVMMILFYVPGLPLAIVFTLLFLLGFAVGSYMLTFTVAREISPISCQGTALGFINTMALVVGALIFQPLIGTILEWRVPDAVALSDYTVQDYQWALGILPLGLLLSLGMLWFVKETYCRSLQQNEILQKGRVRSLPRKSVAFWRRRPPVRQPKPEQE